MNNFIATCLALSLQPFTPQEAMVWQGITDYRLEHGLPAHQYNHGLSQQAKRWACEYPHLVTDIVGIGNSVYRYRGAQHAPVGYYDSQVVDENAWMYAPSLSAVLYGWRGVDGWIGSEAHRGVLLSDDVCAGIGVVFGRFATPEIVPEVTGPVAAVYLVGACE